MRSQAHTARTVAASIAVTTITVLLLAGCVPRNKGDTSALDEGQKSTKAEKPPVFPAGDVPAALLVKGLTYDISTRPVDQDYWAPSRKEAKCTAEGVVDVVGAQRLSDLGYRVATPGAALNDIDLTEAERTAIAEKMLSCVDMREGVAAVFYGAGRMTTREALCLADSLKKENLLRPFADSWAFSRPIDATSDEASLATALSDASQVCVGLKTFTWAFLRLPSDDKPLIDSDAPAGSRSSAYADDRPREDTSPTTTTGAEGN